MLVGVSCIYAVIGCKIKIIPMKLENQNNLVKAEITKLYEMLTTKIEEMEKLNAPRPDVRRVANQQFAVKTILENYFDFHNCNQNKEIEVACKIGDKYE